MDFLVPAQTVSTLKDAGETKMKASIAKGMWSARTARDANA